MKKLTFFMLALTIMGGIFTGCKKDKENNEPTPTSNEYTVGYVIWGAEETGYSPCFKYNFAYTDANGQTVTKENVSGPWNVTITVKAPFTGKIEGKIIYDENELPAEHVCFPRQSVAVGYSKGAGLSLNSLGIIARVQLGQFSTKEKFLEYAKNHPEKFEFCETVEIK